jgi:hypothetical protein
MLASGAAMTGLLYIWHAQLCVSRTWPVRPQEVPRVRQGDRFTLSILHEELEHAADVRRCRQERRLDTGEFELGGQVIVLNLR